MKKKKKERMVDQDFKLSYILNEIKKLVGHEWPMLLSSWVQRRE